MQEIKNIAKALSEFQNECPVIQKNSDGYGYKYTDLPFIVSTISPILKKHGLMFTQSVFSKDSDFVGVKTLIIHIKTGEYFESEMSSSISKNRTANKMNEIQAQGSIITYLRRYSLSSILGIVTDADADGYAQRESKKDIESNLKAEIEKCSNVEGLKTIYEANESEFSSNSNLMNALTERKKYLIDKKKHDDLLNPQKLK